MAEKLADRGARIEQSEWKLFVLVIHVGAIIFLVFTEALHDSSKVHWSGVTLFPDVGIPLLYRVAGPVV